MSELPQGWVETQFGELLLKSRPAKVVTLYLAGKRLPTILILQDVNQHVQDLEHHFGPLVISLSVGITVQVAEHG
jgi:hypothetical protein